MSPSDGRRQASRAAGAPAIGEQDDETAMVEPVRVGLVGLGRIGRFHAANLAGRIPGARLVRVADSAEDVARENASRLGGVGWSTHHEDLLEDPEVEAVIVASPTHLHAEMVEAAAAAAVLARAAERSHREGRTVRLDRETRDGEVFYEEAGV